MDASGVTCDVTGTGETRKERCLTNALGLLERGKARRVEHGKAGIWPVRISAYSSNR